MFKTGNLANLRKWIKHDIILCHQSVRNNQKLKRKIILGEDNTIIHPSEESTLKNNEDTVKTRAITTRLFQI